MGKVVVLILKGAYKSTLPLPLRSGAVTWEAGEKRISQKAHRSPNIKALETTHSNIPVSRLESCRTAPEEERPTAPIFHIHKVWNRPDIRRGADERRSKWATLEAGHTRAFGSMSCEITHKEETNRREMWNFSRLSNPASRLFPTHLKNLRWCVHTPAPDYRAKLRLLNIN